MCDDGKETLGRLAEQDKAIMKLVMATERIADGHNDMSNKMDKLIDSDNKLALILERHVTESVHLHKRIEEIEKTQTTTGCNVLQNHIAHGDEIVKNFDYKHESNKARIKSLEQTKNTGIKLFFTNTIVVILALIAMVYENLTKG